MNGNKKDKTEQRTKEIVRLIKLTVLEIKNKPNVGIAKLLYDIYECGRRHEYDHHTEQAQKIFDQLGL